MSCDLHSHTRISDGEKLPAQVVDQARAIGLSALAITDHDTVDGLEEALRRGAETGQKVIPGVELSTREDDLNIHIVGLYIDFREKDLNQKLDCLKETRKNRNILMLERLSAAGMDIDPDELAHSGGGTITRAHVAGMLVKNGYSRDIKDAIDSYLSRGRVGYVRRETLAPEECINIIHGAGGIAIVAHINQIDPDDDGNCIRLAKKMLSLGADGIETRHGEYTPRWREKAEALAEETGCLRSGGSDYHGRFKKGLELGTGRGDLDVPDEYWQRMENYLKLR